MLFLIFSIVKRVTQTWWKQIISFGTSISSPSLDLLTETAFLQTPEIMEKYSEQIMEVLVEQTHPTAASSLDRELLGSFLSFIICATTTVTKDIKKDEDSDKNHKKLTRRMVEQLIQVLLNLKSTENVSTVDENNMKQKDVAKTLVTILKHFQESNEKDTLITVKKDHLLATLWKPCVVEILKNHFADIQFLELLNISIQCVYSSSSVLSTSSRDFGKKSGVSLKDIHDMVVGHSQFLEVLIDEKHLQPLVKGTH